MPLEAALPSLEALPVGRFEQLPKWVNLVPMVMQWLWLGVRYRSFTLPSSANPGITSGGLVGEGKLEYFERMGSIALAATAGQIGVRLNSGITATMVGDCMAAAGLDYPVVAKPDIGWCGYGVRRIDNVDELATYVRSFPHGETLLLQRYLAEPGEAGLFYMREPDAPRGQVIGILLRHNPGVIGDGRRTVAELMRGDKRLQRIGAGAQLQVDRDQVPARGQWLRLSTVASTRVGGGYEDGTCYLGPALTDAVDMIARDMGEFMVGRFDVRYSSLESLKRGEFTIMEVNGAGSEAVHAWDPRYTIAQAYRIIFAKQRRLFAIADANRRKGHQPIGVAALARLYWRQQRLLSRYPPSN